MSFITRLIVPQSFQSAHLREVRWQHTVRSASSECLPPHTEHKIDVILGIRSHIRILASVLSERKRVNFMIILGSHSNFLLAYLTVIFVAVAKFRSFPPNDLLLVYLVTQPSDGSTSSDNQAPHRTFPLQRV